MKTKADALFLASTIFVALFLFGFLKYNSILFCGPQQFFVNHPLQAFWLNEFFEGNIPWMAGPVAGGTPLWADPNLAIFYPGNLIYLILPYNAAWNLSLIFHLFWGSWGIFWLLRKLELPVASAITGAFAFLFSGPVIASLNSNEVLITGSWIPWTLGLTYLGMRSSARKTLLAALSLSCIWLAGFTFVQAVVTLLVIGVGLTLYLQRKHKKVLLRLALLLGATASVTSIQWVPALLWLPNSSAESFLVPAFNGRFIYAGVLALILSLFALRLKIFWLLPGLVVIDFALFGGSPVSSFCIAIGAAFGSFWIFKTYPGFLSRLVPAMVVAELLIINWDVPQLLPEAQTNRVPPLLQEIPEFKQWNVHQSGTRGALGPVAGLHWGIKYGSPPQEGLMLWREVTDRTSEIENRLRTGKSLQLLRDARIGYVLSDVHFDHPGLGLIPQRGTKFFLFRLRVPVAPLVTSSNGPAHIRWMETGPNRMVVHSTDPQPAEIAIHRNALPGWTCKLQDRILPVQTDLYGWMKIQVPPGNHELQLTYRTPGAIPGTIITVIGTILILAFLLL